MTRRDPELPLEALLEHSAFLRRLARVLVRDSAAADDLAQDTWLAAVRRPPAEGGGLRAWLEAVARRRARDLARASARREERERRSARTEAEEPVEVEERAEMAARVLAAVRALREPYRETVWLRYYDDLGPRVIARRTRVPVSTVETRLRRGRALLRETLARDGWDDAERRRALVALAGLARPALHAAPLGLGVALLPLALVGTLLVGGTDERAPIAVAAEDPGGEAPPVGAPSPPNLERSSDARVPLLEGLRRAQLVPDDGPAVVRGRVLGDPTSAVAGVVPRDRPQGGFTSWQQVGEAGEFELEIEGEGDFYFVAAAPSRAPFTQAIALAASRRMELGAIALDAGEELSGLVLDGGRRPLAGAQVRARRLGPSRARRLGKCEIVFDRGRFHSASGEVPCDEAGRFRFEGLGLGAHSLTVSASAPELPKDWMGFTFADPAAERRVVLAPASGVELVIEHSPLTVRVHDDRGPLDGVAVSMGPWEELAAWPDPMAEVGRSSFATSAPFVLSLWPEADWALWVHRAGYRSELVRLREAPRDDRGDVTVTLASLHANASVRLRVDCGGLAPPERVSVALHSVQGLHGPLPALVTRELALERGQLLLDNLAPARYRLTLLARDAPCFLSLEREIEVVPGHSTIDVALPVGGALEVVPTTDLGTVGTSCHMKLDPEEGRELRGHLPSAAELRAGEPILVRPAFPPGRYSVRFVRDGDVYGPYPVELEPGRVARLHLVPR